MIGTPQALYRKESPGSPPRSCSVTRSGGDGRARAGPASPTTPMSPRCRARRPLADVPGNAAFLRGRSEQEEAGATQALGSHVRETRRAIDALRDRPVWRAYGTTTRRYRLCRDWVGGDPERFKRLLTEQLSPADLLGVSPWRLRRTGVRAVHRRRAVGGTGDEVKELTEPATGEPLAKVAIAGEADVDRAVEAAEPRTTATGAGAADRRSRSCTRSRRARREPQGADRARGAQRRQGDLLRQGGALPGRRELPLLRLGDRLDRRPLEPDRGSLLFYSQKEPVGVAGQIVPWNYPLMMATWKLAPALAAGCAVVLKPDPATPLTALRIAELAAEVGFPPGASTSSPADGDDEGATSSATPGSTRSPSPARRRPAADHAARLRAIKRVRLELGGKSPNLVFADADLAGAVPSAVWSIYFSAGQSCEARSRVLVEAAVIRRLRREVLRGGGRLKVGDPLDPETQIGSLISPAHRDKVHGFVETAGRRARSSARRRAG